MERGIAHLVLQGLLCSGDGTEARPYLVSRVGDEYAVLVYLKKRPQRQSLIHHGDRRLDQHLCQDGTRLWFDVTEQRQWLEKKLTSQA